MAATNAGFVNINSDLGESFGPWVMGNDAEVLKIVRSANVACGFHASDPVVMVDTVRLCQQNGVSIGAHPGFADLQGFGRRVINLSIKEIEANSGTIKVAGRDLADITRKKVPFYRRNIGIVFQDFKLLPDRTVHDNVAYALQVTGQGRKEIRAKVPDILRLTGLATKLHSFPDQLSGGEQQRVAVARAFVNHPPLLLADEPTGNLDPATSIGIMQLLYRINRTGTTVVVATHDAHMVNQMRRRVIEMRQGRIARDDAAGMYAAGEQTTDEFGAMMREVEQYRSAAGLPPGDLLDGPEDYR